MTKKCVVLSNEDQYRVFVDRYADLENTSVYCDNSRFRAFLDSRGVRYTFLDEYSLKNDWPRINAWGCAATSEWLRFTREERVFSGPDLASTLSLFFSHNLIHLVKNDLYASAILRQSPDSSIIIFEAVLKRAYPYFSGNHYLNIFLKERAKDEGRSVETLKVGGEESRIYFIPLPKKPWAPLKRLAERILAFFSRESATAEILVHGSLRHLAPVCAGLRERGSKVVLYDFEFHAEQFLFALKKGLCYRTPSFYSSASDAPSSFGATAEYELENALAVAERRKLFVFEGNDLARTIRREVFSTLPEFLKTLSCQEAEYQALFKSEPGLKAIVLDEDYALRGGFLSALATARGIRSFCVSHANLAVDFSVSASAGYFGQSLTFVQSEFERRMYAARGWDPSKIEVTGAPRYDRLLNMPAPQKDSNGRLKLFYCATSLWLHSPDQHGYLGCHIYCYGEIQVPAIEGILRAIQGLPVDLVIKPHSFEGIPLWKKFLKEHGSPANVTLAKHSDDIFRLIRASDAMLVAYWSTTLIEAALAGLPTIYAYFEPQRSAALEDFAEHGFCELARNVEELRQKIELLRTNERITKPVLPEKRRYYLGWEDARSTDRVVSRILEALANPAAPPVPHIVREGRYVQ